MAENSQHEDRERDPVWQPKKTVQPDPMLQADRRASPVVVGLATVFALIIVTLVFYGLNNNEGSTPTASTPAPPTTSGQGSSSDAAGPPPADQASTAAHTTGNNQGGAAQPANQGRSDAAGPAAVRPGGK